MTTDIIDTVPWTDYRKLFSEYEARGEAKGEARGETKRDMEIAMNV